MFKHLVNLICVTKLYHKCIGTDIQSFQITYTPRRNGQTNALILGSIP